MPKVAVVDLNWNGKKLLEQFIDPVLKNTPSWAEIIVADNDSTDDSIPFLKANFPEVKIIQNKTNGGFAKGYNDAFKEIDADYYVLLNSDVEVSPGWLEPVIELMESDKKIGACQPKICYFHEREKFEYAGAAGGFIDRWGYPFCRGRIFDTCEKDSRQYDKDCEIFWASGACLFVRKEAWEEAKGLDEDFFAHMEEIDFCWRLKNLGWKVMFCGKSVVYHVGGGTLSKENPKKTYFNFRNNLVTLCKNDYSKFFWLKLLIRIGLDDIAFLRFLFKGKFPHAWAVIRAHASFLTQLGPTLQKRRTYLKKFRSSTPSCIYKGNIVWEYFIKNKKSFSKLDQSKFTT